MSEGKVWTAVVLAVLTALWGLSWQLEPQQEELLIKAVDLGSADIESLDSLVPGETVAGGVAFHNQGRAGCRLRARIYSPQLEDKQVLLAGELTQESFLEAGQGEPAGEEYWTARGEYLYYVNMKTGNLLLPGKKSPPLYTEVCLNQQLSQEDLKTLELLGQEQQLFVVAEARQEEGGQWQRVGTLPSR